MTADCREALERRSRAYHTAIHRKGGSWDDCALSECFWDRAALSAPPADEGAGRLDVSRLAAALHIVRAHTDEPSRRVIPHQHPIDEKYVLEARAVLALLSESVSEREEGTP